MRGNEGKKTHLQVTELFVGVHLIPRMDVKHRVKTCEGARVLLKHLHLKERERGNLLNMHYTALLILFMKCKLRAEVLTLRSPKVITNS